MVIGNETDNEVTLGTCTCNGEAYPREASPLLLGTYIWVQGNRVLSSNTCLSWRQGELMVTGTGYTW
jgi:hypothetical protein